MENTSIITVPIFLVLYIHIGHIKLLETNALNAKFDADGRLRLGFISLDKNDSAAIEEAIVTDKNDKNEEKDLQKSNKQLKRQKQCQKQAVKAKICPKTC